MGKAVDLIVVASAWKGLKLPFEYRQPGCICRQINLALFDRTASGLEPGFLVLVGFNAFVAPTVITKQFVQKRFAGGRIFDQDTIGVLSDEFEPVSVCRGNREPIQNKVDATRQERRCVSA